MAKKSDVNLKKDYKPQKTSGGIVNFRDKDIAIVGMACRFPGANNYEEFWENIKQGKSLIQEIPQDRWDWKAYWGDPLTENNKTNSKWGGFIENVDSFDADFFGVTAKEVETMDPQQRMMLELSWSCFEDAGICPSHLSGEKIGVFTGIANLDYKELQEKEFSSIATYYATGIAHSVIASRISYFFNFKGPSFPLDTACSSALTAIHMAIQSLQRGECSMALAGGVSLLLTPPRFICFSKVGILSPTGSCNAFDDAADGTVRGEGAGLILLKPLEKALENGDNIYGILKGSAINHSGKTHTLTYPNPEAQTEVIINACMQAGVTPESISYIETHGTGTPKGDPLEFQGLLAAFQNLASQAGTKPGNNYCGLGAVKTNIGHLESASGIASVIKVLLAMKYKQLPGIPNFKKLNHRISLQNTPFYIIKKLQEWNPSDQLLPRRAGVSAFGFAGTNAHVIIEEAPVCTRSSAKELPYYLICLSAKTEEALRRREQDLALWLEKEGQNNNLSDICANLLLGREHFEIRSAFVVRNVPELQEKLKQILKDGEAEGCFKTSNPEGHAEPLLAEEPGRINMEESLLDKEINEQEYYNKLIGLAESYVKGYNPNWKVNFSDKNIRRIPLPTYPFAKDRYWVPETDSKLSGSSAIAVIHPLLHQNTSDLAEQRFTSTFTGQEFFLADHIVKGESILPGVAYLEMARAAVEQAAVALEEGKTQIHLQNIVWARPIVVGDKLVQVHIALYPEENRIAYEIYSQPDEAGVDPIMHSQGIAVLNTAQDAPVLDLPTLQAECSQTDLSANQLYETFKTIGLDYGPAHRGIEQLYIGENQALARLTLPLSVMNTQDQFVLHPSLMDAALQASIGLMLGSSKTSPSGVNTPFKLSLPFALAKLEIFDKCSSSMWAYIRPSAGNVSGDKLQKLDIDLCDDQGHICVRLKAFTSRTLEGELGAETIGTLILEPFWKEKPVTHETLAPDYAQHLVILCEPDNISPEDIAIRMNKVRCLVLQSSQPEIGERFQTYATQVFEEIQGILMNKSPGQVLIQIVVFNLNERQLCSGLSGLLKTAQMENPKLIGQLVGVEPGQDPQTIIEQLKENSRSPLEHQVRYQDGKRFVAGWREMETSAKATKILWKNRGVFLITGGAGGLGLIFAREIAHQVKEATLILTGRSPLGKDRQAKLKELETSGTRIIYRQVDVTDKKAVTDLIKDIQQEFGNLDGIIHAAGMLKDSFIIKKTREEFLAILAPKVAGLVNLDQASQDQKLDFFILFSSLAGTMGNPGQADYSTANAFMDAYAHYRDILVASGRRYGRTLSINWPLWQEGGMSVDKETERMLQQSIGMVPMRADVGIQALYQGLASGETQVLVAEGNLAQLRRSTGLDSISGEITGPKEKVILSDDSLRAQTLNLVKQILADAVGLSQIQVEKQFEKYGIDSIMQVNIIRKLENVTGELSKTLLFEYTNTQELVDYLVKNHADKLSETIVAAQQETIIQSNATALPYLHKKPRFVKLQGAERILPKQEAEDIAIIGISGRYPMSNTFAELWEHLKAGDNCITEVPSQRWNTSLAQVLSNERFQYQYKKYYGGFLDNIDRFDHHLFEIARDQVMELPPEVRLFLEIVWETLEDAGYTKLALQDLQARYQKGVGVFVGAMYSQYPWSIPSLELAALSSNGTDWQIANRTSHFFNLTGPSIAVNSACSSSLTAIHLACESLKQKTCSMAIAGGVNLTLDPSKYDVLRRTKFLGSGNLSKSFGAGDGYIPGEGVGAVLLKPLSLAIKDHDRIDAVIKSSFVNHSGGRQAYTVPDPKQQAQLLLESIQRSGIDPSTISYVESAANGSELGDPIELRALCNVFGQYTDKKQYCALGSVKSNLGHLEAASGISQLSKVLMQLKHKTLVPSINANPRNPNVKLESSPFYLQETTSPWNQLKDPQTGENLPRRSMINSFGAGGAYTNLIIEEYSGEASLPVPSLSHRQEYLIIFSATTEWSLKKYLQEMQKYLTQNVSLEIGDIERSSQKINHNLEYRAALVVSSIPELLEKLTLLQERERLVDSGIYTSIDRTLIASSLDVDRLILKQALEKRDLRQLAQYWVEGATVDFRQLNDLGIPSIQLPKYAFDHEISFTFEHGDVALNERIIRDNDYTITPEVYVFNEPYLRDHKVYGEQVLIGVTHVSLAINAFFEIFPQEKSLHLHQLNFVRPIVVKEGQRVEVMVGPAQKGSAIELQVMYRYASCETWELTATGNLQQAIFEGKRIDIKSITDSLEEYLHLDRIYTANPAVVFGDSFKTITHLYTGKDMVLARVDLSQISREENHNYVLHPLITNSAFLATAPLLEGKLEGEDGYLPFGIKDIHFQKTIGLEQYWLLIRLVKNSGEMIMFDADLINDESQSVACFSGCSMKRLRSANPIPIEDQLQQQSSDLYINSMVDSTAFSGKIQKYLINKLANKVQNRSKLSNLEVNFIDLGIGSSQLVAIGNEIAKEANIELYPTLFFEYPNIKELTEFFSKEHEDSFKQLLGRGVEQSRIFEPVAQTEGYTSPKLTPSSWQLNHTLAQTPAPSNINTFTKPVRDDIAVIGMHGLFAEADDLNQFWNNLSSKKDLIKEIPMDHWDYRPWFDENPQAKDKTYCKWGSFINDVDKFDANFFNIAPREAEWMDPQLRLLLQSIYAAGEDAGYINQLRGTNTGVFVGVCFHDYADRIAEMNYPTDPYSGTGNGQTMIANRVSFSFDFTGPSLAVDTACSSSLFALHYACNALRNKECDMAFVGGVNLLLSSAHYRYFSRTGALSPTGRCHTFDEAADGYVPGECVASILLKPLQQAKRDGDRIYAVIKGSAALHGGHTPSLTAPSVTGEENVILKAWEDAGINPEALSYIEAHGTGTKLGDPIEIDSIKKAFKRFTKKEQFCAIGSAKAHIGHAEGAAGIAGIIKVILQMKQRQIPAMPKFNKLNPYIQLDKSPFYINQELEEWKSPVGVRRMAGVSSFGFAGTYAHIIIEEYTPDQEKPEITVTFPKPALIVLSAKNEDCLRKQAEQLLQAIQAQQFSDTDLANSYLADIAYTLQVAREAMEERLAITAVSLQELKEKLQGYQEGQANIDDLYRGQVKRNRETLAVFTADEDMPKIIDIWIAKGKYGQLLDLWVKGLSFDWNKLYPKNKPQCISLPTYPFAKERYWLPEIETKTNATTIASIHPLLHQNTSDFAGQRFTSTFTGREFFLADHRVQGQSILPGVAYLEMARAAVQQAAAVLHEGETKIRLQNISWARPIAVGDKSVQVHIGLYPEDDQIAYEIYSQPDESNAEPIMHCQGVTVLSAAQENLALDLEALKTQCAQTTITSSQLYEAFKAIGLNYGPAHQGIEKLYIGQNQILARIVLPASVFATQSQFVLHPSLMDAALQASVGLMMNVGTAPSKPILPFTLEKLEVLGSCTPTMWALIRYSGSSTYGDRLQKLDIDLCDEQGNVRVRMRGLETQEKTETLFVTSEETEQPGVSSAPVSQTKESYQIMTFEEVWQEQALSDSAPVEIKTIVCFLSDPEQQQVVMDAMQALDQQAGIIFISQSTSYQKHSPQMYSISPIDRNTYQDAFKSIKEEHDNVDAILYLWALEDKRHIQDPSCIVHILQAITSTNLNPSRLLLAAQYENALERCYLESWIGFERSVGLVLPRTAVAVVLEEIKNTRKPEMKDWLPRLMAELKNQKAQSVLYQEAERHVCRIRPTTISSGNSLLKPGATYLITGGCGGLGMLFAKHLAKTQGVNLVLTGRSPLDTEKQSKIKVLEDLGSQVLYLQADVCDQDGMKKALKLAKKRFKEIHGLIHAAGIEGNQSILAKDLQDFQKVLAPKIKGTLLLDELLQKEPLDFICYFSSSAAILGDFGSCDYAIGNRFLMTYTHYRNNQQRRGKAIVINWPLWKDGGMGTQDDENAKMYLKSSGQRFLEAEEGLALFDQLLSQEKTQHLVLVGESPRVHRFLGLTQDQSPVSSPITYSSSGTGRRSEMKGLSLEQCLEWDLKEHASKSLKISRDRLNKEENLAEFGFDSITLAQFATALTNHYRIEITPALFFGYSTIEKLTQYFLTEHQKTLQEFYREDVVTQVTQEKAPVATAIPARSRFTARKPSKLVPDLSIPEPIAIIGMSGRFPGARSIDEMWAILAEGQDMVKEIPQERFDWRQHYGDPSKEPGKTNCKWCGCIPGVREFDPLFFDISPREAESMDPRQRLLLQESWNALEDAGYGPRQIETNKIGIFVGVEQGDYQFVARGQGNITSNHNAILASRLAYFLNLNGPVMALDTACSSGLVAAHQACQSLRNQECDTAIVAGINLLLNPAGYILASQAGMLSEDGKCFAFDKRANGMVPGEAVAVVVLKRLSRAEADKDPIYAVIQGSAINYDGKTNGITAPSGVAQTSLLKAVYDQYKVNPEDIEYIVAHGTGTKLGDSVEINALCDAFKGYTKKQGFCALTSTKTNLGHTFAASGLVSLISLVQSMRHETIPASLHCEQENNYINWKESPFYVNKTTKPWSEGEGKGRVGAVSAFGMGGTNAHMVVRSYPTKYVEVSPGQPSYYLLALSARTQKALQEKIQILSTILQRKDMKEKDLLHISYTLLEGRQHFNHRCAIVVQDCDDAIYVWKQIHGREKLPNLFQGEVPRDFKGQKMLQQYAQDLLKQSVSLQDDKNKYQEILFVLADLYCQGYDLDWNILYPDPKPWRISLPTYPFAKEHYWIREIEDKKPNISVINSTSKHSIQSEVPKNSVQSLNVPNAISTVPKKTSRVSLLSLSDSNRDSDFINNAIRGVKLMSLSETQEPLNQAVEQTHRDVKLQSTSSLSSILKISDEFKPLAHVQPTISVESLREELKTSLAEVLRMQSGDVNEDIEFVDMGLDSVTGVEWIQAINRQYGTSIPATKIYDYPSIRKMANYLVKEMPKPKEVIIQASPAHVQPTISVESLREELKTSLAEVLRMQPDDVDEDKEFVYMGLDSVTGVEWIQAINRQYGTSIQATKIYDYPCVSKMANYLVKELSEQKVEIIQAPIAHVQSTIAVESLCEELKISLAEVLRVKPDDIDVDIEFVDMGLDSVTGVEWIQAINRQYGTSIQATKIYDYPCVSKMANYLIKELPEQKEVILQAPPIKSTSPLSLDEILHQVKNGVIDSEQADRLLSKMMGA